MKETKNDGLRGKRKQINVTKPRELGVSRREQSQVYIPVEIKSGKCPEDLMPQRLLGTTDSVNGVA